MVYHGALVVLAVIARAPGGLGEMEESILRGGCLTAIARPLEWNGEPARPVAPLRGKAELHDLAIRKLIGAHVEALRALPCLASIPRAPVADEDRPIRALEHAHVLPARQDRLHLARHDLQPGHLGDVHLPECFRRGFGATEAHILPVRLPHRGRAPGSEGELAAPRVRRRRKLALPVDQKASVRPHLDIVALAAHAIGMERIRGVEGRAHSCVR